MALLNEICDELITGNFLSGMERLCGILGEMRSDLTAADWNRFCRVTMARHPIHQVLREGPIAGEWLRSPPARSNNSRAFEMACGLTARPPRGTALGKTLFRWEYGLRFSETLRHRHQLVLRELTEIAKERENGAVLSLGHSHVKEPGLVQVLRRHEDPVLDGKDGGFDFIYALDLFDHLDTQTIVDILPGIVSMLKPNGRLLAANLTPDVPEAAYLEACMAYWPSYRSELDVAALTAKVPEKQIASQCVFRDECGYTVFLEIERSSESESTPLDRLSSWYPAYSTIR